jgi:hypothetical protein
MKNRAGDGVTPSFEQFCKLASDGVTPSLQVFQALSVFLGSGRMPLARASAGKG